MFSLWPWKALPELEETSRACFLVAVDWGLAFLWLGSLHLVLEMEFWNKMLLDALHNAFPWR